jgi:hypothetical protein
MLTKQAQQLIELKANTNQSKHGGDVHTTGVGSEHSNKSVDVPTADCGVAERTETCARNKHHAFVDKDSSIIHRFDRFQ